MKSLLSKFIVVFCCFISIFAWGQLVGGDPLPLSQVVNSTAIDLPDCDVHAPGMTSGVSIGIASPNTSSAITQYAVSLALKSPEVRVCSETWQDVLPSFFPWAKELERYYGYGLFVIAFLLTVGGLYKFTARSWWSGFSLTLLLAIFLGTWVIGVGLLKLAQGVGIEKWLYHSAVSLRLPQEARATWFDLHGARELEAKLAQLNLLPKTKPASTESKDLSKNEAVNVKTEKSAEPSGVYIVYHRLNVRDSGGVQSPNRIVLNRGDKVEFAGAREGDWWRIKTATGLTGWASSLWLRRPEEMGSN